ncbi:phosphatase [Brevibacillus brevis]|uniref:HAD family hydrolase n=1 Tax=Brevibacillus brevis TaxID=1393 RepID=UPI000B38CAC5|nr:HAD-IA family hydrolase [Brevibacillus brevis]OUQ89377.1 phosphatase [Brevibacillus brevis]
MNRSLHKGIIFDMDNTLLQSRINFSAMKQAIFQHWVDHGICEPTIEWEKHTASQLIEIGRQSERMTSELEQAMWEAVTAIEKEGMHGAVLEKHAVEVLDQLKENYHLYILTNNAYAAAVEALKETGIASYFDEIVAREQMTTLKPSPSGIHYIRNLRPDWPDSAWTMIGDSWIDGKAAIDGQVAFISYQGNQLDMERHEVTPVVYITDLLELLRVLEA